ncbi:hypothetical protein [Nocardiopsis sp. CC223A]|uniref:hypothetical protein n=1 Tax=Nocardiopsis sp. CC223A TaxID=3044051 RepID=UPI00278C594E|nr:hypothetical protein [Nocardiopsis sp. CC223A]
MPLNGSTDEHRHTPEETAAPRRGHATGPGRAAGSGDPGAGGSGGTALAGRTQLAGLRRAVAAHRLVNLTGPVGSGKTRLAARLGSVVRVELDRPGALDDLSRALAEPSADLLVVDNADRRGDLGALRDTLDRRTGHHPPVLVLSRRPLLAHPAWTDSETAAVTTRPLPDTEIEALATAAGIDDPAGRALVTSLAAGVPLLAAAACRALHDGAPAEVPGAVADHVTGEILQRLGRELPGRRWQHALRLLATVGAGDERLLNTGPELFGALAGLSLVRRTVLGLALPDPYREVMELAYRWRRPVDHGALRGRAAGYRAAQLRAARTPAERAHLVEQGLFLADDPSVRRTLRPMAPSPAVIRPAGAADADDVGRLMHQWALHSGFDTRRSDRLAERWLGEGTADFVIARDDEGRPVGVANLTVIGERTLAGVEPLLQQHAEGALGDGEPAGLFVGAAFCPDPMVHAQLLRHTLTLGVEHGRVVVSTASPDYRRLLGGLRFRPHGAVRDDIYGCGQHPRVFSNDMAAEDLPMWLDRLADQGAAAPTAAPLPDPRLIGRALRHIGDPVALARSPLLAAPHMADAAGLRAWLHEAVRALTESPSPTDAEAGRVLRTYYLERCDGHVQAAARLHLSRATYFRRLRHGLAVLAAGFAAQAA